MIRDIAFVLWLALFAVMVASAGYQGWYASYYTDPDEPPDNTPY